MKRKFSFKVFSILVGCSIAIALFHSHLWSGQGQTSVENKSIQEKKIAERIRKMKEDPKSLYFAKSELPLAEQEKIATGMIAAIKKMDETGEADEEKVIEMTGEVLRKAPATKAAQMAHWNLHEQYLILEDNAGALAALESYLEKYQAPDFLKKEAYDKLAMLASKLEDWGLSLYYAEKFLELDSTSFPLMLTKARALVKLGAKGEGEKLLRKIAQEAPDSVQRTLAEDDLKDLEMSSQPAELVAKYGETLDLLREIAMAIAAFQISTGKLPDTLASLVPEYLQELKEKDAWGNKLIYKVDPQKQKYWLASAGSDGKFSGFDQEGEYSELAGKDIIFSDAAPIFVPRISR